MTYFWMLIAILAIGLFVYALLTGQRAEKKRKQLDQELANLRQHFDAEKSRLIADTKAAVSESQRLMDEELANLKAESERIRQHYESEANKTFSAAETLTSALAKENASLKRFQAAVDAEAEAQRILNDAMREANALRTEAHVLLERTKSTLSDDKAKMAQRVREMGQQADALLAQATKDAGRIVAEAHKRAHDIGGAAYDALRDKEIFEKASDAMKRFLQGYGDNFIIPSRSLLDELAEDFSHTAAGSSLRAAKQQAIRMVEQGEAATSEYVEQDRRNTAIRFIIDAFNGRVDAILSRTKRDNYGKLEQEIRDAFSLVNLNGVAFRNTSILPAYLDARLAELKWGCVVQELKQKEREEQQRIREQIREEEKARREYEQAAKEAAQQKEILDRALEEAQRQIAFATEEQRQKHEQEIQSLKDRLREAEEAGQRAISMAQQTKKGKIYVISNVGSLGENVYKIGMTRRLVPQDRIDELGDASVPFPFDVHAWIDSDDAPALESQLHDHFVLAQVNKVNLRKEFFRVDLAHIRDEIAKLGYSPHWTMVADATQFRETQAIERSLAEDPSKRAAWVQQQVSSAAAMSHLFLDERVEPEAISN